MDMHGVRVRALSMPEERFKVAMMRQGSRTVKAKGAWPPFDRSGNELPRVVKEETLMNKWEKAIKATGMTVS